VICGFALIHGEPFVGRAFLLIFDDIEAVVHMWRLHMPVVRLGDSRVEVQGKCTKLAVVIKSKPKW
jgi:hypothetical protein